MTRVDIAHLVSLESASLVLRHLGIEGEESLRETTEQQVFLNETIQVGKSRQWLHDRLLCSTDNNVRDRQTSGAMVALDDDSHKTAE